MPCRIWEIWVNCAGMSPFPPGRIRALAVAVFVACVCRQEAARAQAPATVAARAGLRVLEGRHLTLITDRPDRPGDGVADLPRLFDEAFAGWCRHFAPDPGRAGSWRACGCLMVDRERFRRAGLLPDDGTIPDFENGYCAADRFWMTDQSNPAYRRHLLLHEGVHAFTLTLRSADAPPWYTEGIAEHLATHRLERDAAGIERLVATAIPERPADVEQLGRIEYLRQLRTTGQMPGLDDVFSTPPEAHRDLAAYAASWAAVTLLAGHPAHAAAFAAAERGPLDQGFTARLTAAPGWNVAFARRDFDAFTSDLDYGYDFARSAVDWSAGRRLAGRQAMTVSAERGWQNCGWSAAKGVTCSFAATGRCMMGLAPAGRLESPPDGISLAWYRGRPVGRLLVAQWVEPDDGTRPAFAVLAEGAAGTFTAATDGPLYWKVNEGPGALADNSGAFAVTLE